MGVVNAQSRIIEVKKKVGRKNEKIGPSIHPLGQMESGEKKTKPTKLIPIQCECPQLLKSIIYFPR